MINNIKELEEFLDFTSNDDMYAVQIFKRKKENPEMSRNAKIVRSFIISGLNDFYYKSQEIKEICEKENARAYLYLNKKSFKKCLFSTYKNLLTTYLEEKPEEFQESLENHFFYYDAYNENLKEALFKIVNTGMIYLQNAEYDKVRSAFFKAIGNTKTHAKNKLWIVDIDNKSENVLDEVMFSINQLHNVINEKPDRDFKIHKVLSTKNGYHVICNPFDVSQFNKNHTQEFLKENDIEIEKDGLTVLYHHYK